MNRSDTAGRGACPVRTGGDAESGSLSVLEVFADVWCPFTHVGLRRLIEERDHLGRPDIVVRVRAWPLELVNGRPLSARLVTEEIDALRETVAPDDFQGFDPGRFPVSTLPALALAASAYRRNDGLGERVSLALRAALFEEGRDISDPAELAAVAQAVGMSGPDSDADEVVRLDWQEGRRRGVVGSPHFFAGGRGFFCPSLSVRRVGEQFRITLDPEGYAGFVRAVFAPPTSRINERRGGDHRLDGHPPARID
jgi:predicted DsbA family dithiol-disulfide isomerase